MAKRVKRRAKSAQKQDRKTNWVLIGGIVGIGVIGLFALLFASLQGAGVATPVPTPTRSLVLEDYCAQNPDNCIVEGADSAPVTLVEVSDYGCGHCKNFNLNKADTLKAQYVDSGQLRWITVPFALGGQTGYPTAPSANAAMCAAEQNAFTPYHKALFQNQGTAAYNTEDGFLSTAASLDLDLDAFQSCLDDNRHLGAINENIQVANATGVNSTPTFFINGQIVRGNADLSVFQQLIEAELSS